MTFVNKIFATFMVMLVIFNLISVSQGCAQDGMSCDFEACCGTMVFCNPETKICEPGFLGGGDRSCSGLGESCNIDPCCPGELRCHEESQSCQLEAVP